MGDSQTRRGAVLVLVLAILAVLSVLGVAFTRLARVERQASSNHVLSVLARMAGEAGLEHVHGALLDHYRRGPVDSLDPAVTPWVYPEAPGTPLHASPTSSFQLGVATIDGTPRAYAGALRGHDRPGLHGSHGVMYTLRVTDCNARLDLNGACSRLGPMLDRLGEAIALYDGVPDPIVGRGDDIVRARDALPGGRFDRLEDLAAAGLLSTAEVARLRPYLTVVAYRDPTQIAPRPQKATLWTFPSVERLETLQASMGTFHGPAVYDLAFERALTPGGIEGRAPVNVNQAPKAVLHAVLRDLEAHAYRWHDALTITFGPAHTPSAAWGPVFGLPPVDWSRYYSDASYRASVIALHAKTRATGASDLGFWAWGRIGPIDEAATRTLVEAIDLRRRARPFHSLHDLADAIPPEHRALVLANANPNARLCKFNPDLAVATHGLFDDARLAPLRDHVIDKTDFTYATTEFSFQAGGLFEVESLGRVVDTFGRVLASCRLVEELRAFEVLTHTSQRDFAAAELERRHIRCQPENRADQGEARLSALDGQLAVAESTPRGAAWVGHMGETQVGGPNGEVPANPLLDRHDDRALLPPNALGEPAPTLTLEQAPPDGKPSAGPRGVTGEHELATQRLSDLTSQLFSDGRYTHRDHHAEERQLTWSTGRASRSPIHPKHGGLEFWVKTDALGRLRARSADAAAFGGAKLDLLGGFGSNPQLACWTVLGPNAPVTTGSTTLYELYSMNLSWDYYQQRLALGARGGWGRFSLGWFNEISPAARRAMDIESYPAGQSYAVAGVVTGDHHWAPQEWNHLRIEWQDWLRYRVYINGTLALDATGFHSAAPGYFDTFPQGATTYGQPKNVILDRLNVFDQGDRSEVAYEFWSWYRAVVKWQSWASYGGRGTVSRVATWTSGPPASPPARLATSAAHSPRYVGRFRPAATGPLLALFARFTAYQGWGGWGKYHGSEARLVLDPLGTPSVPVLGNSRISPPVAGIDRLFDPALGLPYGLEFDDGGQLPYTQSAYVDDVSLFYSRGTVSVIRRTELPD